MVEENFEVDSYENDRRKADVGIAYRLVLLYEENWRNFMLEVDSATFRTIGINEGRTSNVNVDYVANEENFPSTYLWTVRRKEDYVGTEVVNYVDFVYEVASIGRPNRNLHYYVVNFVTVNTKESRIVQEVDSTEETIAWLPSIDVRRIDDRINDDVDIANDLVVAVDYVVRKVVAPTYFVLEAD